MSPFREPYCREPYSADGESFIRKERAHEWEVWFKGHRKAVKRTRREARILIRKLRARKSRPTARTTS